MPTETIQLAQAADDGAVRVTASLYFPTIPSSDEYSILDFIEAADTNTPSLKRITVGCLRFAVNLDPEAVIISQTLIIQPSVINNGNTRSINIARRDWGANIDNSDFVGIAKFAGDAAVVQLSGFIVNVDKQIPLGTIEQAVRTGYQYFMFCIADSVPKANPTTINEIRFYTKADGATKEPRLVVVYSLVRQPEIIAPKNGQAGSGASTIRLSWNYFEKNNYPQGAYTVRIRVRGAGTWLHTINSTTAFGTNSFHDLAAGFLANGEWEWQVQTFDLDGLPGAWSNIEWFKVGSAAPVITAITAPTGTINNALPLATWTKTGATTAHYRWQVLEGNSVVYDSGLVASAVASHQMVAGSFTAGNGSALKDDITNYKGRLFLYNSDGVSSVAEQAFQTNFTNPPAPGIAINVQPLFVRITPTVVPGTPTVVSVNVYRKDQFEAEMRFIKTILPAESYDDYFAPYDRGATYYLESVGDNTAKSTLASIQMTPRKSEGFKLFLVENPEETIMTLHVMNVSSSGNENFTIVSNEVHGRTGRVHDVGEFHNLDYTATFDLLERIDGQLTGEYELYCAIVRQLKTVCLLTPMGGRYIGLITAIPTGHEYMGGVYQITLTLEGNDWKEGDE